VPALSSNVAMNDLLQRMVQWLALAGLAMIPAAALACDASIDPLGPRYRVHYFDYGGDLAKENSEFRSIMIDKVLSWGQELEAVLPARPTFPNLELIAAGPDTLSSITAVRQYWVGSHSLEVLKGMLQKGSSSRVYSRIFLGELGTAANSESLVVSMPLSAVEMGSTMDAHSIVTYFALAMELQRRKCDRSSIVAILSRVQEKFADLRRRKATIDSTLVPIEQAVTQLLSELAKP
jgi:hypothetical protein